MFTVERDSVAPFKLLLIQPRGPMYRFGEGIFRRPIRYSPLTLTTLASLIPPDVPADVRIVDEGIESVNYEQFSPGLVGISAITGSSQRSYAIAGHFRKRGIPVVLGGVHPTLMPDEAQEHADAVVTGFAEQTWPQLLRDFRAGTLRRRYAQQPDMTLENLPLPRRDLLKRKSYVTVHSIQATRGCTNLCDFCIVPVAWGRRMYLRPVNEVVREIEAIDGKNLLFVDVSPIEDREYALKLYTAMIPLKKQWVSPCTMRIADDPELLKAAADSGCRGLLLGIESVEQNALLGMHKGFNSSSRYEDQIKRLHGNGIALNACFVFGSDKDTKDVFDKTVDFAIRMKLDLPRYTVFTPFPGTPVHKKLEAEGRILERDWSLYDAQHVVFRPLNMTPDQLQAGLHRAWRQTYTVPAIAKRLIGNCIVPHITVPANIAYRSYARHLPDFTKERMLATDRLGLPESGPNSTTHDAAPARSRGIFSTEI